MLLIGILISQMCAIFICLKAMKIKSTCINTIQNIFIPEIQMFAEDYLFPNSTDALYGTYYSLLTLENIAPNSRKYRAAVSHTKKWLTNFDINCIINPDDYYSTLNYIYQYLILYEKCNLQIADTDKSTIKEIISKCKNTSDWFLLYYYILISTKVDDITQEVSEDMKIQVANIINTLYTDDLSINDCFAICDLLDILCNELNMNSSTVAQITDYISNLLYTSWQQTPNPDLYLMSTE